MKVNEATRKVMGAELEWLPGLIPEWITDFQVKMIDLDTLSLHPDYIVQRLERKGVPLSRILLLDEGGVEICGVGEIPDFRGRLKFGGKFPFVHIEEEFGLRFRDETVEEALKHLRERAAKVRYILELGMFEVTLHKMPRKMVDLPTWMQQKSAEALGSLHRALNQDR